MIKSEGRCKIDGVAVGEVSINLLGPTPIINTKYMFLSSTSGERFGAGNRNANWSEGTFQKLHEFIDSMEKDLCLDVFNEGPTSVAQPAEIAASPNDDGVPGL